MKLHALLLSALFSVIVSGCAVTTGPVNDGFELSQESHDIGSFFGDDLLRLKLDRAAKKDE